MTDIIDRIDQTLTSFDALRWELIDGAALAVDLDVENAMRWKPKPDAPLADAAPDLEHHPRWKVWRRNPR